MPTITLQSLDEVQAFAARLAKKLKGGDILGLVGDLGSGKTTFTQMLAFELGVKKPVKSPTFILMQLFDVGHGNAFRRLCHVDAYRIEKLRDLRTVGFEEYAGAPDIVTVVEWADRVPEIAARTGYRELRFAFAPGGGRTVTMTD